MVIRQLFNAMTDSVSARLRRLRAALEMDQAPFARSLGMSQQRYSNYERNYPLPLKQALAIVRRYPVDLNWIYEGKTGSLDPKWVKKLQPPA